MKTKLGALMLAGVLLATLTSPLWAAVQIQELLVRRQGSSINIRISLDNPGQDRVGPVLVDLYVRKDSTQDWQQIKHWDDVQRILPNHRLVRDFFDTNSAVLHELAQGGAFEARTVVTAPGTAAVEQTTSWHDEQR